MEVDVPPVLAAPIWFGDAEPNLAQRALVAGLLGQGDLALTYGASSTGKTSFMLDMALGIARGGTWNGRHVEQGVVLYGAGEGHHSVIARVAAYRRHHFGDARPELPFAIIPQSIDLLDPARCVPAVEALARKCESDWELPVRFIVIDTLARSMSGADENSGQDMGAAIDTADRLRAGTGATVMPLHHTGKSENGARGHSSLRAAVDTEIEVSGLDGVRTVKVTKQRDLPTGDTFAFSLKPVPIGQHSVTGEIITACVVEYVNAPPSTATRLAWGKNQLKALTALREWARVNESAALITSLDMAAILKAQGIGRQRRPEVLNALVNARIISPSTGGHTFDRGAL